MTHGAESRHGSEPPMRHGWRGIKAPVEFAAGEFGKGWLAVGTSPHSGDISVSVWTGETWAERKFAFWMEHDAARKLIAAVQEELPMRPPDDTVQNVILWRCHKCGKTEPNTGQRARYCGATRACTRTLRDGRVELNEMARWEFGPLRRVR